jgi:hypothetical protein
MYSDVQYYLAEHSLFLHDMLILPVVILLLIDTAQCVFLQSGNQL